MIPQVFLVIVVELGADDKYKYKYWIFKSTWVQVQVL